ncbi:hypothetical protein [Arthrobacter sp. AD-310]
MRKESPAAARRHAYRRTPDGHGAGDGLKPRPARTRLQALRQSIVGAVGLVVGLLPHVLHHIGLLAGTALVAGSGGTALFGALGFVASIPMLAGL